MNFLNTLIQLLQTLDIETLTQTTIEEVKAIIEVVFHFHHY